MLARYVYLSVRPHCTTLLLLDGDFHENLYVITFWKSLVKIQVLLKFDKNNGYVTWRRVYIYDQNVIELLLKWDIFETIVIEKIKTCILCSIIFFSRKSCRLWDNVEKYGRGRQATDGNIQWYLANEDN
jgi:hypothetical protein